MGVGGSVPRPGRSNPSPPPGKDQVPIVQEAGWAPGSVSTGAENLAPHRDSIPGPESLLNLEFKMTEKLREHRQQFLGKFAKLLKRGY